MSFSESERVRMEQHIIYYTSNQYLQIPDLERAYLNATQFVLLGSFGQFLTPKTTPKTEPTVGILESELFQAAQADMSFVEVRGIAYLGTWSSSVWFVRHVPRLQSYNNLEPLLL